MLTQRIERALEATLQRSALSSSPPRLTRAIRHAVFPGGARIRPQLCLAVAMACGDDDPHLSDAMAVSLELIHCASLVHDDLPCFDNAALRRGQPSVHAAFGERIAVLAGDGLIVMSFAALAGSRPKHAERLADAIGILEQAVGPARGIVAGQAWECEPKADLATYQREKTGSLFTAATAGGAASSGADPRTWQGLGDALGEAYQVADDIRDVLLDVQALGKPAHQDETHDRPSAARELGLDGALNHFNGLITRAVESIPSCRGALRLRGMVLAEAKRLLPDECVSVVRQMSTGALVTGMANRMGASNP